MARQPRLDLPGIPRHVVQRGNDRQACFAADVDYGQYLRELQEAARKHGCAIHAFVLMTNHVHLLVTPTCLVAVSRMTQAVGRRYVGLFNARYRRTGTLRAGRFKAALIDSERYLMACHRYIELNPVRARMTTDLADYRWSIHGHDAMDRRHPLITPHRKYLRPGLTPATRQIADRALIREQLDEQQLTDLRLHTRQQRA